MRSSRCQGSACALRRSSSACDSFGPIRRMTNRPRFSEKMVLLKEEIQCSNIIGLDSQLVGPLLKRFKDCLDKTVKRLQIVRVIELCLVHVSVQPLPILCA